MKTVLYEKIDGFNIVKGFDKLLINPIETQEIVNREMKKTKAYKTLISYKDEIKMFIEEMHKAKVNSRKAVNEQDRKKFYLEFQIRFEDMKKTQETIKNHLPELKKEKERIIKERAVYFEPRIGEKGITEDNYNILIEKVRTALSNNKLVTIDGDETDNHAGKTFYKKVSGKWNITYIDKIGIKSPANSKEFNILTTDEKNEVVSQIELNRISDLSNTEKTNEKQVALDNAIARAARMRSELEIQNDSQALQKSQDWYNAEVALIEKKYA